MRFPSLHKLHAQKYKTSLSHRFMQCSGKPGRWVIFHIPFCAVSARGATAEPPGRAASTTYFNSRPCERGDPDAALSAARFFRFQFTPLREGRHQQGLARLWTRSISIHAPARGATQAYRIAAGRPHFNSRPCERGDKLRYFCAGEYGDFNSRPCERGDAVPRLIIRLVSISIHAPARGATVLPGDTFELDIFQFTPLREGRPNSICGRFRSNAFQFTPLREGRLRAQLEGASPLNFNSRPCERGDIFDVVGVSLAHISIHAPARGATAKLNKICSVFSAIIEKNS